VGEDAIYDTYMSVQHSSGFRELYADPEEESHRKGHAQENGDLRSGGFQS